MAVKQDFKRFDMKKPPHKTNLFIRGVVNLLCLPGYLKYKPKITYVNGAENLKGPFLLLCNHNAFLDFKIANILLGRNRVNYVASIDGFIGREGIMRLIGIICKRKFTNDLTLIKQLKQVIQMGNVAAFYPEARYSLCGTTAVLPQSLGKLAKLLDVPVATLVCNGHHINSPFWDTSHERGVDHVTATYTQLFTQEKLRESSVEDVNRAIVSALQYDDFAWQKENHIEIKDKNRADGLHRVLYQCPDCGKEYQMDSKGTQLFCKACGKTWEMTELGELKAIEGETKFSHIPDWYEWERANVRKEIENGTYSSGELQVKVNTLPNAKRFIFLGTGTMCHDMHGFRVSVKDGLGKTHEMVKDVPSLYSCHIEYRYLFKFGDCIDLSTLEDTWYIYPSGDFAITKMALATEELYLWDRKQKGNIPIEGMV